MLSNIEQRKPKVHEEENRRRILAQLEKQIQKDYPDCALHAFGSFYNGFGFCDSDLDVCIVFKDGREQNVRIISTEFHIVRIFLFVIFIFNRLEKRSYSNDAKNSTLNEIFKCF